MTTTAEPRAKKTRESRAYNSTVFDPKERRHLSIIDAHRIFLIENPEFPISYEGFRQQIIRLDLYSDRFKGVPLEALDVIRNYNAAKAVYPGLRVNTSGEGQLKVLQELKKLKSQKVNSLRGSDVLTLITKYNAGSRSNLYKRRPDFCARDRYTLDEVKDIVLGKKVDHKVCPRNYDPDQEAS